MGGTKKRSGRRGSPRRDQYTIVLENLLAQNKVFGEGQQGLQQGLDEVRRSLEDVRGNLGEVRGDLADLRGDLDKLKHHVDAGFARVDRELGLVKSAVTQHTHELREIRTSVTRIEGALEKKVDRDELEARIQRAMPGR